MATLSAPSTASTATSHASHVMASTSPSAPLLSASDDLFAGLSFPEVPTGPVIVHSPIGSINITQQMPQPPANMLESALEDIETDLNQELGLDTVEAHSYSNQPVLHQEDFLSPQVRSVPSGATTHSPEIVQQVHAPSVSMNFSKLYQSNEVSLLSS
jgi:hypothetical protein